jgi:aromatic-L-amino-acid/L-tryptophan decarboxylase
MSELDWGPEARARWMPPADELRRLGHEVVELLVEHLAGDDERRAFRPFPNALARALLDEPLPEHGEDADAVLDRVARDVVPYPFGNGHPRFLGWVNGPPVVLGVLAEAIAAAMNPSVAGGNHAATYVEHQVLNWLAELVGFPRDSAGLLVSGGSAATLHGLAVARHRATGGRVRERGMRQDTAPLTVYTSTEGHTAIAKAVELLGVGSAHLRRLPVDAQRRLRVDALRAAIARDRAEGRTPMAVAVSAGTVNTGAVDPLAEVADLCAEEGVWMHVDGAYGAPAVLDPGERAALAPLARADSLALDPHKWLGAPVDAGAVLVRDAQLMRDAFSLVASYVRQDSDPDGVVWLPWFSEFGAEQTRPFRALKVWVALRRHGRAGYAAAIGRDLRLAARFAALVDAHPELELVARGLSIVCLRCVPRDVPLDALDALNRRVLTDVQLGGEAFLSGTQLDGRTVLRACFLNPRTTADDVERIVALLTATARRLVAR